MKGGEVRPVTARDVDSPMADIANERNGLCPFCGRAAMPLLHARDLNRRTTEDVFVYYRCTVCFLVFLLPIPTDPGRYYLAEYYPVPSSLAELEAEAASERYKIEWVKRLVAGGRVLDIGAGYGRFVYLAHRAGYQIDAIEVDGRCCEFITGTIGTRAIAHGRPEVPLAELDSYDVITSWHVLEHLTDPWSVLKAAVKNLRKGGWLIIATPNPESVQFRVFGRYWAHLDAPRHLQLLPVGLLTRAVTRDGGMRIAEATATDPGSLDYNYLGWTWSLRNLLRLRGTWRIGAGLARLVRRLEQVGMRGSCYTVVFQKNEW